MQMKDKKVKAAIAKNKQYETCILACAGEGTVGSANPLMVVEAVNVLNA